MPRERDGNPVKGGQCGAVGSPCERVSEPAARKLLRRLSKAGGLAVVIEEGSTTRFKRDPDAVRFARIKIIADEATSNEVETAIRELKTEIQEYEDTYGVSDPRLKSWEDVRDER